MRGSPRSGRSHTAWRWSTLIGLGAVLGAVTVGWPVPGPGSAALGSDEGEKPLVLFGSGTLTTPNSTSKAITYNPALAPVGAALTGTIVPTSEGSTAELTVFGLLPHRGYAVYAYTRSCGVTSDAAGTRFENLLGPAASVPTLSASSADASPGNEIGLVVRTDSAGAGTSRTTVPFTLTDRVPGSMMVQDSVPPEDSGQPDKAGSRIACLTLSRR